MGMPFGDISVEEGEPQTLDRVDLRVRDFDVGGVGFINP
jgi:hypothetical protein